MEGDLTIILALLVVFGAIGGGVALFRRRERKREMEGEGEDGKSSRPRHTVVEDDSADVQLPRSPQSRTKAPE